MSKPLDIVFLFDVDNTLIDNDRVQFSARFNGVSQEVSVPTSAVSGIFAKETGYGFAFAVAADPVASLDAATAPTDAAKGTATSADKSRRRSKHLQVIK